MVDAEAIAEAAADSELRVIEGGLHNDLWMEPEHKVRCEEAVSTFLERVCSNT